MSRIIFPARESLELAIDGGLPEDYHLLRLYHSWYAGWFYRHRLEMVVDALGDAHYAKLLEVGLGSGALIKELLQHADHYSGIDIHKSYEGVQKMLQREGVDPSRVDMREGSIFEIPYPDATFDALVCISVLEHFADPCPAISEMARVVKPGGRFAFGFPAYSGFTDALFKVLGYDPRDIHPGDHRVILQTARECLNVKQVQQFPFGAMPMYIAVAAEK